MAAAMALMESPAIIMAVLLANWVRQRDRAPGQSAPVGKVLHESLTDGAQLLLLGAMLVGLLSGEAGQAALQPFAVDLFKGMLAFFLLDMGLLAARNMGQLKGKSPWLLVYAIAAPLGHATLALLLCAALGVSAGNAARRGEVGLAGAARLRLSALPMRISRRAGNAAFARPRAGCRA